MWYILRPTVLRTSEVKRRDTGGHTLGIAYTGVHKQLQPGREGWSEIAVVRGRGTS